MPHVTPPPVPPSSSNHPEPPPTPVVVPEVIIGYRRPGGYQPAVDPNAPVPAWKKYLGPVGVFIALLVNFGGKLKFIIAPALKFLPAILKTGGTMIITIGVYTSMWGWKYAVGFVVLIFIHEMGHVFAARKHGVAASAPMFIPFMGAFIALKEAPKNAVVEAEIGIAGPVWGTMGAVICNAIGVYFDIPLFIALAWTGYWLNLFNLIPVGQLDGGHVVQAISPWLWLPGFGIALWLALTNGHFIIWLIVILAIPRVISLFRPRTDEVQSFYSVPVPQRWRFAIEYFGLIAFLVYAMDLADQSLMHLHEVGPVIQ